MFEFIAAENEIVQSARFIAFFKIRDESLPLNERYPGEL